MEMDFSAFIIYVGIIVMFFVFGKLYCIFKSVSFIKIPLWASANRRFLQEPAKGWLL